MPEPEPRRTIPWNTLAAAMAVLVVLSWLTVVERPTATQRPLIPYSEFRLLVEDGVVSAVELQGEEVTGTLVAPRGLAEDGSSVQAFRTRLPAFGDDELLARLERQNVTVAVLAPAEPGLAARVLLTVLPWLLLIGFFIWISRRGARLLGGGAPPGLSEFLGRAGDVAAKVPDLGFDDVAGHINAKREVQELVAFLKAPQRYQRLGAEAPHGVLLMGPPGTGKTLMAKALAGEAGVPFFSISGSAFIEVFVGVGASRVRKLFETARKHAPSIVFIDELDSVGRTRGTGLGGGHDEREQTLNQILAEMDGFEPHEAVIVLAATNRPDVLDPALLRPGRFDRHVTLELPDRGERAAILRVHTRKVPLAEDVELMTIAAGTPGFSGADLRNLVNEAAMMAARENAERITMRHIEECRDRILLGAARTLAIQPAERHRLAIHEAGHTTVAYHLPHADPLYKVTIIPRGRALGGTHMLPEVERHTLPEDYLRARLAVMLAGRAAERVQLGSASSGADDDIRQATALAKAMVARWGMSEAVGPVDLRDSEEQPFLGREIAQPRRFSEHSAQAVDDAVRLLLQEAESEAEGIIRRHREALEQLVAALEARETLDVSAIRACLGDPDAGARLQNQRAEQPRPASRL